MIIVPFPTILFRSHKFVLTQTTTTTIFTIIIRELMRSLAMQGRQRAAQARQSNMQRVLARTKLFQQPESPKNFSSSQDQKEDITDGLTEAFDIKAVLDPRLGACAQFDGSWIVVGFRSTAGTEIDNNKSKNKNTTQLEGPLTSQGVRIGDRLTAINGRDISDPSLTIGDIIKAFDAARRTGETMEFSFARDLSHHQTSPSKSPPRQCQSTTNPVFPASPTSPPREKNAMPLGFISTPSGLWR